MADMPPAEKPKKAKKSTLTLVEKSTLEAMLEKLNEEYAVILRGSQVHIMRHWISEDKKSRLVFLTKRDFLIFQENNVLWTQDEAGKRTPISIAPAWLKWSKRKTFEEVYFEPGGLPSLSRYNIWQGFAVEAKEGGKYDIFLDHVKNNICRSDEMLYAWVLAWIADMFQCPNQKPGTALVLRGKMGVGKGQFAHHIGRLLGLHYMSITQASQLTGKFNAHMMDKILMFVDEGWWNDERNGVGTLNALITEPSVAIEMKGKDAVFIANYTRFIIGANADRIVQTGLKDERRMAITDVGEAAQQNTEYFSAMQNQLNQGGYEALLHFFLNYPYDKNLPRTIPQTDALEEHRLYSMPDEIKWWQDCLILGKIGTFKLSNTIGLNYIETEKFYSVYIDACNNAKVKPFTLNVLPKKLKPFVILNKIEKWLMSERDYYYSLETLDKLRADFEDALGQKIDWN